MESPWTFSPLRTFFVEFVISNLFSQMSGSAPPVGSSYCRRINQRWCTPWSYRIWLSLDKRYTWILNIFNSTLFPVHRSYPSTLHQASLKDHTQTLYHVSCDIPLSFKPSSLLLSIFCSNVRECTAAGFRFRVMRRINRRWYGQRDYIVFSFFMHGNPSKRAQPLGELAPLWRQYMPGWRLSTHTLL